MSVLVWDLGDGHFAEREAQLTAIWLGFRCTCGLRFLVREIELEAATDNRSTSELLQHEHAAAQKPDVRECSFCRQKVFVVGRKVLEHETPGGLACSSDDPIALKVKADKEAEQRFDESTRKALLERLLKI